MAKIRIYELARDLSMPNKELLEKLSDLDIPVKNHMSSLDEEAVKKIKGNILSVKPEEVEETRVKPTIIRRRRKATSKKPSSTVDLAPEPERAPIEEEADSESTPKDLKKEEDKTEKGEIAQVDKTVEELKPQEPEEKTKAIEEEKSIKEKAPAKVKKIGKKKKKKEAPAKIIKMPDPQSTKEKIIKEKKDIKEYPTNQKAIEKPEKKDTKTQTKPKKKIKEPQGEKESSHDKKFFKKKISFKRKEVIERSQLYDGNKGGRRGKKGQKAKISRKSQKTQITTAKAIKRRIKIGDTIILSELAKRLGIKTGEIILKLMDMGVMATANQTLDFETSVLVASEFEYEIEKAVFEEEPILRQEKDDPEKMSARPPVVTVMGHVDHGKTSLLDVIRETSITKIEAGGITQHIGAYYVTTDIGQIVFLDTPGHEAFTSMRARGASVTDLVVLVVAADDGVMPQTMEAINHAKAAKVPIIIAVNKIDKVNADPDRVKRQLAEAGLTPEDWGGDTIFVHVSAKTKEGIDELLEMILLQAEVLELKANPDKLAIGRVVEAKLDAGRGPVATILIQEGTLNVGNAVVCGVHYGKIRYLFNDKGQQVKSAGPSIPVEIFGLSGVPMAGDELVALSDEKNAKQVSQHRIHELRSKELAKTSRLSLEKLFEKMKTGELKELNIIIKADVNGSIEALKDSLIKLSNDEVKIEIIHSATGAITESDIPLATVSNAIIIGFNVRCSSRVQNMANEEQLDMRFYNVIYNVIKDVKDAVTGMMSSKFKEIILGRAEVRDLFTIPKIGTIAGSYVTEGKFERGKPIRLVRDGTVSYEGTINSLRRFKDDVKEVQSGYECGISLENYNDIKVGDDLECFFMEEIRPEIE